MLGEKSIVYAVDKNAAALKKLQSLNTVVIEKIVADFITDKLSLSNLDGILMANSLHFVKDKATFINKAIDWVKTDGCILIVEYDTDISNAWVPYPVSYSSLKQFFEQLNFGAVSRLHETPSKYHREKFIPH